MIDIKCPKCSTQYRISDSQIANITKLRCKKCNTVFQLQEQLTTQSPAEEASSASEAATLAFDLSKIPLAYPHAEQQQETASLNIDLGNLSFDSVSTEDSSASPFGGALGSLFPPGETSSTTEEEEVEIEDHISAPLSAHGAESSDFSSFSFSFDQADGAGQEGSDESEMDNSFSAAVPEMPEGEEGEASDENSDVEQEEEQEEPSSGGSLDLSLGAVEISGDVGGELPVTFDQQTEDAAFPSQAAEETLSDEYVALEEELSTCCVDSLAMGLPRCELCGKDLHGKDPRIAQELQKRRRQQLKQELSGGNVQIGFSEEQYGEVPSRHVHVAEDFSDVEKALDDLASGTFHHTLKKKDAKKHFQKTLRKLLAGAIGLVLLVGVIFVFLLPSKHEKLQARYDELMAQEEIAPDTLVKLFFDAIIAKDQDIFSRLSVIPALPAYSSAKIISVGEEYENTSIGAPGKKKAALEQEIADIEGEIQEKSSLVQEYSSKNLSPTLLEEKIAADEQKLADLKQEFDEKDVENRKKVDRLQADLQGVDQDSKKVRDDVRKYIDKTDDVSKAIYKRAVSNQQFLTAKKDKLLAQLREEQKKYEQLHNELEEEYQPQFLRIEERLATERSLLREANQLQDKKNSPVVVLTKEIEQLSQIQTAKKEELAQVNAALSQALAFFANQPEHQELAHQPAIEFSHVSKNVAAIVKDENSGEQQISVVLKRYQAVVPENKTVQSPWLVEKISQ